METKICSIPDCDRPPRGRGLCGAHYEQIRRAGQIPARRDRAGGCTVDGCNIALVVGNGLCEKHYRRWRKHGHTDDPARSPAERFWDHVDRGDDDACWHWTAAVWNSGYGFLRFDRTTKIAAHRLSYEIHVGPIPAGLTVDHLCHNRDPECTGTGGVCAHRRCVNPVHLEAVTQKENVYRGDGVAARHARKTHCLRGHSFEPPNGYVTSQGRRCRACDQIREARKKASRTKQAE